MERNRVALSKRMVKVLKENKDLLEEALPLNQSSCGLEWFDDVVAILDRFVSTSSSLNDKELFSQLLSPSHMSFLLRDELLGFGLDADVAERVERLLCGVLSRLKRAQDSLCSCRDLILWVHGCRGKQSLKNSVESRIINGGPAFACVDVSEEVFLHMKQQTAEGTDRLLGTLNAGAPGSVTSEAFSFELLSLLMDGPIELEKTEIEISYKDRGKITDYCFRTLYNVRIGVSVSRALGKDFDDVEANRLLQKKLVGIFESSRNVSETDGWTKQVLHIWCENKEIASVLETVYHALDDALKCDTFVLLSVIVEGVVNEIFYANETSANLMRYGGITINSVKGMFSKEVASRPSYDREPKVPPQALACGRQHIFFGDLLGGLHCQICDFETKDRVWKCKKECGIALCGNCMDKWKNKMQ